MSKATRISGSIYSAGADQKTVKGEAMGYLTAICYMSPHTMGLGTVCPFASKGCAVACLVSAGKGTFPSVIKGRQRRRDTWDNDREGFHAAAMKDLGKVALAAHRLGLAMAIRPDGTSDGVTLDTLARWDQYRAGILAYLTARRGVSGEDVAGAMDTFDACKVYSYTKRPLSQWSDALAMHDRLSVCYSYNESRKSHDRALEYLEAGHTVAAVLRNRSDVEEAIAGGLWGATVVDGDESDLRHLDAPGSVVALVAKGKARSDRSGFVLDYATA